MTNGDNTPKPLDWPPIKVDVRVPTPVLAKMLANVQETFRHLENVDTGKAEALEETYRAAFITDRNEAFFESGKIPVHQLLTTLRRCDIDLDPLETCFELGCGLGRTTIWLSEHFQRVVAADISGPHLAATKQNVVRYKRDNVAFIHTESFGVYSTVSRFDALFSIVVLQHNPPPVIYYLLNTLLKRLNSGGVAYFQVPTYRLGYSFNAEEYIRSGQNLRVPPMHVLPQAELFSLLEDRGCRVVEIREDSSAGGQNVSSRVLAQKR